MGARATSASNGGGGGSGSGSTSCSTTSDSNHDYLGQTGIACDRERWARQAGKLERDVGMEASRIDRRR